LEKPLRVAKKAISATSAVLTKTRFACGSTTANTGATAAPRMATKKTLHFDFTDLPAKKLLR